MKLLSGGRFKKLFESNLERKILYLTVAVFFSVFLVCFVIFAFVYSGETKADTMDRLKADGERVDIHLADFSNKVHLSAYSVTCSRWAQQLLRPTYNLDEAQRQINYKNATHVLNLVSSINNEQKSLFVTLGNEIVKSNNTFPINADFIFSEQPWYDDLLEERKYLDFSDNGIFAQSEGLESIHYYYLVRSIYDFSLRGYYAVNIPYEQFKFLNESVSDGVYLLLQDQNGSIITSNIDEDSKIMSIALDSQVDQNRLSRYSVVTKPVMQGQWQLVLLRQNTSFLSILGSSTEGILILVPIVLVFMMLSLIFSRYLSRPIVLCTRALSEIRNHKFGIKIENRYSDEIGEMIEGFNSMSAELADLIEQNRRFYELQKAAEFNLLQQRINPHFLCNTLEIINGMILSDQNQQAMRMCEHLGLMYRYDLGKSDIVEIRQEVDYLKTYLEIVRYSKFSLSTSYEIDDRVLSKLIIKLIIQPIVENSIRHGFREKAIDCHLSIQMKLEDDQVLITITDNGEGISEEELANINRNIDMIMCGQDFDMEGHIGLMNTVSRLYLHYGNECSFNVESIKDAGTKTVIAIPAQE